MIFTTDILIQKINIYRDDDGSYIQKNRTKPINTEGGWEVMEVTVIDISPKNITELWKDKEKKLEKK